MKKYILAAALVSMLFACRNKEAEMQQASQLKSVREHDSLLGLKSQAQDSTITAYIKSFNDIQDNLDSIKTKAKIMNMSVGTSETTDKKATILSDMRYISQVMAKNKEELAQMKKKLSSSGMKNGELEKMIAHLTEELTEKDADIAALQSQLAETNANLKTEIKKFNDSMDVISHQHVVIAEQNTIYYAVGTTKELKNKGVIMKSGGVLGVGGTETLKPNTNTSYFTSADMYSVHALPLFSKLDKIITSHPNGSYTIHGDKKADSLIITDQKLFWSESKYLVIVVKQR
jgi:septal ring factor EnvC (AmiA/AmiB activator)